MEIASFLVLILLSLVGYCAGAVAKAGKTVELKPQIADLILVLVIWGGAISMRLTVDLNKWLMILLWVILSSIIGAMAIWPRRLPEEKALKSTEGPQKTSRNFFKKLWQKWENFSKRMGAFQTRIIISLFFFVFVTPFALAVKIFSDPLKIKHKSHETHWLPKKKGIIGLDEFKRQF